MRKNGFANEKNIFQSMEVKTMKTLNKMLILAMALMALAATTQADEVGN